MRMDPNYEAEEMETNMESMFEHVNQMCNTDMPRDFLASMTRHFLREDGEKFTTFQKFQTEACLLLEQRRQHWRKRKAKSASQFLSMFYLIEKEVVESQDDVAQSLFVEAFHSREAYVESVMEEFDEIDKIEKKMATGNTIKVPGFVYDEDDDKSEDSIISSNEEFDYDNCVLEISEIIEDLNQVDKSKYVKIFEKDGEASVGIYNTRIKALAKRKSALLSPFPLNVKGYPKQVKSGTKTFTKLTSTSSVGAANTSAGYCMIMSIKYLSLEARSRMLTILERDDLLDEPGSIDDTLSDEGDLLLSQDFPNMYQSQTSETLLHCTICELMCRSRADFEKHMALHPTCDICKKQLDNNTHLQKHIKECHQRQETNCNTCGKQIPVNEVDKHKKEHEMFESFKKSLDKTNKKPKTTKTTTTTKTAQTTKNPKTMNCYLVFVDEMRPAMKENNPTLTPVQITKKISEEWHKLSVEDKEEYKKRAAEHNNENVEQDSACPKCEEKFKNQADVITHLLLAHVDNRHQEAGSLDSSSGAQSRIFKCSICGKMLLSKERLEDHKRKEHSPSVVNTTMEVGAEVSTTVVNISDDGIEHDEGADLTTLNEINNVEVIHSEGAEENIADLSNTDTENFGKTLVWVKLASIFWPARMIGKVDGELSEIELFDGLHTKKTVEHIKLKPFEKLKKIPVKRSKYWKEFYALALLVLEN